MCIRDSDGIAQDIDKHLLELHGFPYGLGRYGTHDDVQQNKKNHLSIFSKETVLPDNCRLPAPYIWMTEFSLISFGLFQNRRSFDKFSMV